MSLTAKRQRFVDEYVIDLNATQAAIRAGYTEHTAKQQGSRLLTNADIAKAIADKSQKVATATTLTAELVLTGLLDIAQNGEREANRVRSWELLGKHLALFTEKVEVTQVPDRALVQGWIEALTADVHSNS